MGEISLLDAKALLKGVCEHLRTDEKDESERVVGAELTDHDMVVDRLRDTFFRQYLAYAKFYNCSLPVAHPEHYYAEREWRKFGPMPLRMGLKEVVLPNNYAEQLEQLFPQYKDKIRPLNSSE